MDETRKKNQTVGQIVRVPCIACKRSTNHIVLASYDVKGETDDPVEYEWHDQIVECQGCEETTFRTVSCNSEETIYDDKLGGHVPVDTILYYPSRSAGRVSINYAYYLPKRVKRIYDETIGALNSDQPVLAGIGLRALVETVCKDKNAAGSNLFNQINDLVTKEVLTANGAGILHKIRTLGNSAAHEVEPHTSEQLGIAMDVCEHLLQDVYIIHHHANKL